MAQDAQPPVVETAETPALALDLSSEGISQLINTAIEKTLFYLPKIIIAFIVLWIGFIIARKVFNFIQSQATKSEHIDTTLGKLAATLARYGVITAALLIAVSILGAKIASIMGIFAAATLAIGLALQGSMSNVAAGLLLIILRPFKVGDFVEVVGEAGTVEDMNIFTTTLRSLDNIQIIVSNSEVRSNTIKNLTSLGRRRVDVDFGIDYGDDIDKAIGIIKTVAGKDSRVLSEPEGPWAKVSCLNDSSVDIQMRVWCLPDDYWDVRFDLIKSVKEAFDKGGISIPYPHVVEIEKKA